MVSLTPGGSKATVTDQNKMDYLNQLAQYRLGKRMSEEIRHFLKGFPFNNFSLLTIVSIIFFGC